MLKLLIPLLRGARGVFYKILLFNILIINLKGSDFYSNAIALL